MCLFVVSFFKRKYHLRQKYLLSLNTDLAIYCFSCQDMTELGKRRYPELSEEDIEAKRMKIHSTNKFTLKSNQEAARQFKDFLKDKEKDVNFEEYGIPELDHALSQFYLSARKEDGSFYKVASLKNFRYALNRYLKSPPINKKFDIRTDPAFHDSNINFLAAITELKRVGKGERNPYSPISEDDLNKMYTSVNMKPMTPRGLYNKVQFEIRMHFCRHGSSPMKDMTISTFEIVKDTETNRRFVQRSKENECGTESSQACKVWKYVMQDIPDSPYCPVASYELYLKKLHPDNKFLWQRPRDQFPLEDPVWFSVVRVGEKSLSGFMSKLSSECGLSKTYSNLCIKATEIAHLTHTVTALNSARMVIMPKSLPSLSADQHYGNILIQNAQTIYKKKLYDPFAIQNACKSVQEGLSVYRAAITHGVPESILRDRIMGYVSVSENSNITSTPQIITLTTQGNPVSTQTRLEQSNIQIDPEWRKQAEKVDLSSQLSKPGCVMLVPVKKIIEGQPITPITSPLTLGITSNKPHFRPIACKTDKGEIITSSFAEPMKLVKNVINRPITRSQQTGKTGKTSENQSMSDKTQESRINDILSTQHSLKIMAFVPDQDQSPSLETQGTGSKDTLPAQSQLQQSIASPSSRQKPSPAGSTSQIQEPSPAGSTEFSSGETTHQHENSKRKETSYLELNEFRQSQRLQEESFNTNSQPENLTADSDNDNPVSVPLDVEVKEEPESEEDMTELGKRRYPELSEEDIKVKRMKIHSTNKFTLKANQEAARLFKDFLKEKDKDVNFEDYGIPKLDHALSQFYLSARKEDGSFYKVTSLKKFRFSLNRYLKSPPINKKFDIRTDTAFHDSNINYLAAITELKSVGKGERNSYSPISEEDLNKIYTSVNMQPTTPRGLYNKVQFEIRMHFCRHGSSAMKDMTISTFEIVKDTETNRRFVQRSKENECGTESGQACKVWKYVMQDIPDSPYCPVASYELYLKKLHPDNKFLWQRPKDQFKLEDPVWFSVVSVGEKSLSGFMSKLSSECGLSKTYSNLCIRATEIVHLTRAVTGLNSARMVIMPKSLPFLSADQHCGNILIQNAQKIYKKKLYDPFALQNACKSVQEGLSVYRAAITHGVPESILRGRTMGYVSVSENSKIIEGQPITPVTSPLTLGMTSNKPHFRPIACKTDKGEIITSSFAEPMKLVKNVTSENQSMSDKTQESRINDIQSTQHSKKIIMAFVPDQDQSPSLETQETGSKDTLPAQSQLQQSIASPSSRQEPSPAGSTSRIQQPSPTGSTSQIQGPSPAGSTSQIQGPSPAGSTELSSGETTHHHENSKRKETSYLELNEFRQSQELQEESFNANSQSENLTADFDNDNPVSVPLDVEVKEEPESEEDQINRLIETDQQLQSLKSKLQKTTTQLSKKEEEFKMQQSQIGSLLQQMKIMRQNISSRQRRISELENFLSYETVQHDKKLFKYYTGYTPEEFQMLYQVIVPENSIQTEAAIQYLNNKGHGIMGLKTQLLMTLNKLRNNFTFLHLAHLHSVTEGFCRNIFRRWLKLLAEKFEHVYIWPHRGSVRSQMPEAFAIDFPDTVAILKRVQVKMGLNSLESVNSRTSAEDEIMLCNRHAVLAVDPRGSIIWCSKLSKGNLSDRELFIESGLKEKLQQLVCCHWLQVGDGILADETFGISEELDELGLVFNHVAFSKQDIEEDLNRILCKERIKCHKILIDKAYARVKKFRILTQKIPSSLTSLSDIILQVCSFLPNFQTPLL